MLTFVPTPIGNLQDITPRILKSIEEAEIVYCEDTRVSKRLIHLLEDKFENTPSKKEYISLHSHNEDEVISSIDIKVFDKNVIYMSDAGMPCISDPGAKLVAYAQDNGIEYDFVAGVSAGVLAYGMSGFSDSRFNFYGFLPHKRSSRLSILDDIIQSNYNTILYESPHRIEQLFDEIISINPDIELFVAKELTKMYQFTKRAKAKAIKSYIQSYKGEWVVVVQPEKSSEKSINKTEILNMDIPPKIKAKLLSTIDGESTKEWYNKLIKN